jgi:hypothetical protein
MGKQPYRLENRSALEHRTLTRRVSAGASHRAHVPFQSPPQSFTHTHSLSRERAELAHARWPVKKATVMAHHRPHEPRGETARAAGRGGPPGQLPPDTRFQDVRDWPGALGASLARLCCWAILQLWHWRVHDLGVCMAAIASAARLRPAVIIELSLCHWSKSICERLRAHGDTSECGTQIRGWFARLHRAHSCVLSLTRWRRRFPT